MYNCMYIILTLAYSVHPYFVESLLFLQDCSFGSTNKTIVVVRSVAHQVAVVVRCLASGPFAHPLLNPIFEIEKKRQTNNTLFLLVFVSFAYQIPSLLLLSHV